MGFKIQHPRVFDRTDGDVILINKSILAHTLELVRSYAYSGVEWSTALGFSATFFLTALVTENFKSFGPITGENIRNVLLVLGIVAFLFAGYRFLSWLRLRKTEHPDKLIRDMLNGEPQELERQKPTGVQKIKRKQPKSRANNKGVS